MVRDLVTVGPAHTLAQAAKLMSAKRVGSAIVLTEESPGSSPSATCCGPWPKGPTRRSATVGDYMTWNAIVATSEWDTMEAARTMLEHGFRHLLVIDGDHRGRHPVDPRPHGRPARLHPPQTAAGCRPRPARATSSHRAAGQEPLGQLGAAGRPTRWR